MKNPRIEYDYIVHNISDGKTEAYKAVIPAFNGVVFGENLIELEEGIALAIEEETKARKAIRGKKSSMPAPDRQKKFSGKFVVRINPFVHEKLALEAKARGKSLNTYLQEKIAA